MAGLSLAPWQWGVIAVAYVLFFVIPAIWMWRLARRDGDAPLVWASLVLVGSFMGIYEYFHHRSILRRREKRRLKDDGGRSADEGEGMKENG